jgi:hypothetical protein
MARLVTAVAKYGPKVARKPTAQLPEVSRWIARGTGLTDGQVSLALKELRDAILYFNASGSPVKLDGIGIFGVSVDRNGRRNITFYADQSLRRGAATSDLTIRNHANIGLDNAGYKALWDADHPDDPLDIPEA